MMGSLYSAVSGLRNHQLFMDVVGNNIANVNTLGYRGSRVVFQDILSQVLRGASAATASTGGVNPLQIGLGAALASTDTDFGQGTLLATGNPTDMAIQGDGLFILSDGKQTLYTRAGAFNLDSSGRLVDPATGMLVQGWTADSVGNVDTTKAISGITVPLGETAVAQPTQAITLGGNLNANAAVNDTTTTTIGIYDSLGNRHDITLTFTKSANNTWSWTAAADPADTTVTTITPSPASTSFVFNANGQFDTANNPTQWDTTNNAPLANISIAYGNGATTQTVKIDLHSLTQLANVSGQTGTGDVTAQQDGSAQGTLSSISVGPDGTIVGVFSNGLTRTVGQLALARFANPTGLVRTGDTAFAASAASGTAEVGTPESGGRGSVSSGYLEQSNVDLAQQFTNLIMAERGFQANSRVITATDEMLQDLVNIKR